MVKKQRYAVLYGEFENEKKKDNIFLTFRSRDSNLRLSVMFEPLIWISQQFDGESKNVPETNRTLSNCTL